MPISMAENKWIKLWLFHLYKWSYFTPLIHHSLGVEPVEPLQGDMCKATLGTYSNLTYADDHLPRMEEIPGNFAGF